MHQSHAHTFTPRRWQHKIAWVLWPLYELFQFILINWQLACLSPNKAPSFGLSSRKHPH